MRDDISHAFRMMGTRGKLLMLGVNFIGGCFGPGGIIAAWLWNIGYIAGKSKEVDYTDPVLIKLVMDAHRHLPKEANRQS